MHDRPWGAITPAEVSELMSFEQDDIEWQYDPTNNRSMAAKQAEVLLIYGIHLPCTMLPFLLMKWEWVKHFRPSLLPVCYGK